MRTLLFFALIACSVGAVATVYKWVGPDGEIQYSDRPVVGAERVGITRTPPPETAEAAETAEGDGGEGGVEDDAADPGPYASFEIVDPETNATLRHAEGKVEIGLVVDPPFMPEHRLQILVDGNPVPGDIQGTQIALQGVPFGSHRVQAQILDELDALVASSPVVDFHLRKPVPEPAIP